MDDHPGVFYVVRNTEVVHLATSLDNPGKALCGSRYLPHTASVVSQQPANGKKDFFTLCKKCVAKHG